jgi:hypothetical protein
LTLAPAEEMAAHIVATIDPPIRLDGYPDELIDSTEAAASFIERHDDTFDFEGVNLVDVLRHADTPAATESACLAFRQWAEGCGLLSEAAADSPP